MIGIICFIGGLVVGGFIAVVIMCLCMINKVNYYERKICELKARINKENN